ncbi:PEP/pyruvate-binding domain-containing protein, partial [Pseudomonas sp. PCH446]
MPHSHIHIRWFKELGINDVALVGGKNASLGEMYRNLAAEGVRIPNGFAITSEAYRYVLEHNKAWQPCMRHLTDLTGQHQGLAGAGGKG